MGKEGAITALDGRRFRVSTHREKKKSTYGHQQKRVKGFMSDYGTFKDSKIQTA